MIVGQVIINGISFSCHRYLDPRLTPAEVKTALEEFVYEEGLCHLGNVEVRVQANSTLERLMDSILGRGHDD